ncbi:MAG: tyrosine-type recombinase/integrase, partial [Leisingera sp.]
RPHSSALAREDALAIAILLVCPLRVKNLAGLEFDRHIQRPGDGRVFISLTEDDTKTGRPIEFELPPDLVRLLDAHLATRVPYMCPAGTPYLFPQRSGKCSVDPSVLADRIARRVRKETGLTVNAHLFRHFAVMNWLDANPGSYEVARRLLGHSELSHTINMYSGMEAKSATRAFADLIDGLKRGQK